MYSIILSSNNMLDNNTLTQTYTSVSSLIQSLASSMTIDQVAITSKIIDYMTNDIIRN